MAIVSWVIGNLLLPVERGQTFILIPLDISESFNMVDHKTVLSCLREVAGSKVIH